MQIDCSLPYNLCNMTNSFFQNIFASRNINAHDGKPLWKYDLTDKEFYQLNRTLFKPAHCIILIQEIVHYILRNGGNDVIMEARPLSWMYSCLFPAIIYLM